MVVPRLLLSGRAAAGHQPEKLQLEPTERGQGEKHTVRMMVFVELLDIIGIIMG